MIKKKTLSWFIRNVHKRVYREYKPDGCKCPTCQNVLKYGVRISDRLHAEYLHDASVDMDLNYSKQPFITN